MGIERKFRTELNRQMESAGNGEKVATEEEKAQTLENIFDAVKQAKTRTLYDKECYVRFMQMAEKAVSVADWICADFSAEIDEQKCGTIHMETELLAMGGDCPEFVRKNFLEILSSADEIWIYEDSDLIKIDLSFYVYKRIVVAE